MWVESYQGEVIGEVVFSTLAEDEEDDERRAQLFVLARLERVTKELAQPVFERQGFDRGDIGVAADVGAQLAEVGASISWEDFLGSVESVALQFLDKYLLLVELAPDEFERDIAKAYVAHEEALLAFVDRALGREEGDPLQAILAVPHYVAASRA
jgi:hypothetical protein